MLSTANKSQAELQSHRNKLASSYNALHEEFGASELRNVGNYELHQLIGKGSFGKVYLATHKLINGSKVVLKSARKDDPNLAREIHHHRQFLHPHIARLYEVITTETLVWLVLEYCPGDELYYYLTQHGPLEPSFVQRIFAQIVGAVSYVHSKSCVHRDLKLENILLDKSQNVKLCDFGFTREYEGKSSYLQTWCGTVCYAAPEMLKGEKYAGEKVDVWSLGIILYALLCGELPFDEDDESQTKSRILKDEPKYPETMPQPAKELINSLLSKRPLLRPSLSDILAYQWLSEHAPSQQAILKLQRPPPFSTPLETEVLQRMRSAGVNIDLVIENVLSQRCDSLAGWWGLLSEKEERKAVRRERKRKEKEADAKANRRISAASARLERIAPTIKEADEEDLLQTPRGREPQRPSMQLDRIKEVTPDKGKVLPPTPKGTSRERSGTQRTASNPRRRSQVAPRDYRKRASGISLVATNPELLSVDTGPQKRKRRYPQPFMHQLASIKHWFKETSKRAKSPNPQRDGNTLHPDAARRAGAPDVQRLHSDGSVPRRSVSRSRPELYSRSTYPARPRVATNASNGSARRPSISPSPLTPSGSYRRSTGSGLRGRKSTSSSVSSMRSVHAHHASLSIASSTSSNSIASPSLAVKQHTSARRASPNLSTLKVLPKTPTGPNPSFSNDLRFHRKPPNALNLNQEGLGASPFAGNGPSSPGLMFARRKRTAFKGPMLGPGTTARRRSTAGSVEGSVSGQGRRSGEIIEEEDEDVEEVDTFSPVDGPSNVDDFFNLAITPSALSSPDPGKASTEKPVLEQAIKPQEGA